MVGGALGRRGRSTGSPCKPCWRGTLQGACLDGLSISIAGWEHSRVQEVLLLRLELRPWREGAAQLLRRLHLGKGLLCLRVARGRLTQWLQTIAHSSTLRASSKGRDALPWAYQSESAHTSRVLRHACEWSIHANVEQS